MSVSTFIKQINEKLEPLFEKWTGSVLHGYTQSMIRKKGNEVELLPAVVDKNGEGKYVGPDDTNPVSLYHKLNNLNSTVRNNGVGDSLGDILNTYQNSMVVFLDRKKTNLLPDELLLYIQANFPERLKIAPYKNITIKFTGVILNSRAVFEREFQGTAFKLPNEKTLFEINYTIESLFSKECFNKCPC